MDIVHFYKEQIPRLEAQERDLSWSLTQVRHNLRTARRNLRMHENFIARRARRPFTADVKWWLSEILT